MKEINDFIKLKNEGQTNNNNSNATKQPAQAPPKPKVVKEQPVNY